MKNHHFLRLSSISKMTPKAPRRAGESPGTIAYLGKVREHKVKIELIDYNKDELTEKNLKDIGEALVYRDKPSVTWLNITGVHDTRVIEAVGEKFELHPLILEDITNTTQRPKIDDYGDYLFIVAKMSYYSPDQNNIIGEQVSLIVSPNFVISFQEQKEDILDPLRERIRSDKGKIRKMGTDYLAYAIIDAIVDHYFVILEQVGEEIEEIEEKLIGDIEQSTLNHIYRLKRELIYLRKSIWPMREVVGNMLRGDYKLIAKTTGVFLRDVYDHTIQVVETIETFRDMVSGMLDLYLSNVSNRMNEVMKVLTIFAAIFIPLTFIAGVYGMNFEYMPELKWRFGYPALWVVFISLSVGMVLYFKKKKWL